MLGSLDLAAALLLAAAGLAKLAVPGPAAAMLRRAWRALPAMPVLALAVRAGGAVELAVAAAVVASGGRLALGLLAACYLVFAVVSVRLTRLGQRASCGCFGGTDSPVGLAHVLLNVVGVAVAVAGFIRPPGRAGGLFAGDALAGAVGAGQAGLLAYLGFLSITALPALAAERHRVSA